MQKGIWGGVFNAVAPFHPSRMDYYTGKANEMGLAMPQFSGTANVEGKIVESRKIQQAGYLFKAAL